MISDKDIQRIRCTCNCQQPVTSLAVDKSGTIYACSSDGLSLLQISADFSYHSHQVLQKQTETPMSLFYCNKENKLYVGTGSGIVRIFNVG
jgi:ligand-binding sensor domain-containing protein